MYIIIPIWLFYIPYCFQVFVLLYLCVRVVYELGKRNLTGDI